MFLFLSSRLVRVRLMVWWRLSLIRRVLILVSWVRRKIMRPAMVLVVVLGVALLRRTLNRPRAFPVRFQLRPQTLRRLMLPQRPPMVLPVRFRRLRPILHQPKVLLAMFQHHPPTLHRPMFLPLRLRMRPVRLLWFRLPTLTLRRPRVLMMWFRRFPLTLRGLRFQRLPPLTLTRHRLRALRLTFHPCPLAPITPTLVTLRRPHRRAFRPLATWRHL